MRKKDWGGREHRETERDIDGEGESERMRKKDWGGREHRERERYRWGGRVRE